MCVVQGAGGGKDPTGHSRHKICEDFLVRNSISIICPKLTSQNSQNVSHFGPRRIDNCGSKGWVVADRLIVAYLCQAGWDKRILLNYDDHTEYSVRDRRHNVILTKQRARQRFRPWVKAPWPEERMLLSGAHQRQGRPAW